MKKETVCLVGVCRIPSGKKKVEEGVGRNRHRCNRRSDCEGFHGSSNFDQETGREEKERGEEGNKKQTHLRGEDQKDKGEEV